MNRSRVSMWIVFALLWSLGPLTTAGIAQEDEKPQYKGRIIAQTMHWKGAEWLLRETREKEERVSVLMEALGTRALEILEEEIVEVSASLYSGENCGERRWWRREEREEV